MAKYMKTIVYVQAPSGKVIPESQYKKLSKKARKSWHRTVAWGEWEYSRKQGKYIQIRSYGTAWSAKSKRQINKGKAKVKK